MAAVAQMKLELHDPSVVVGTVLMVVGGSSIQTALAQASGSWFSPVCFSFGWVSYAFSTLGGVFSDGRLLPLPDHSVKVFNLDTGYVRNNRSWVIGRIVRDHEIYMSSQEDAKTRSIRIAIFDAESHIDAQRKFAYNSLHAWGILVIFVQLAVASIPAVVSQGREWRPLVLTSFGTVLASMVGALPQWAAEKLPRKSRSNATFALTAGNGSRDILVIKGQGKCIDLEDLATAESPKVSSLWTKIPSFSNMKKTSNRLRAKEIWDVPIGFLVTCFTTTVSAILWLIFMICLAGLNEYTWSLLLVGFIGTIHNIILGGMCRDPKHRNLPLNRIDTITANKVMDGLMDLEVTHPGCARALVGEFFPGKIRLAEEEWWDAKGDRSLTTYDKQRVEDFKNKKRTRPRSAMPFYNIHAGTTERLSTLVARGEQLSMCLPQGAADSDSSQLFMNTPRLNQRSLD